MTEPDVSVVVVSWNTRDLTLACLDALARDVASEGLAAETILVDNASADGTADAVRRARPDAEVIEAGANLGFAAGANLGIGRARGRYVLLLNSDATVAPGTVGTLVRFLDATPRAAVAGGLLVSPDGDVQFSCGRFLTPANQFAETLGLTRVAPLAALRRSYSERELAASDAVRVDWVVGACAAVRRAALDEVGRFDERFFMYSEDEDLCYRIRAAGWEIYVLPRVRVTHVGGASAAAALEPMRAAARASQIAFVRKHRGTASAALFRALMWIAALKPRKRPDRVGWGG